VAEVEEKGEDWGRSACKFRKYDRDFLPFPATPRAPAWHKAKMEVALTAIFTRRVPFPLLEDAQACRAARAEGVGACGACSPEVVASLSRGKKTVEPAGAAYSRL
jgi:hypothetical protein